MPTGDDIEVIQRLIGGETDPMTKMMLAAAMQAKELARTKELAEETARRLSQVEEDINDVLYCNGNYCTVIGFCSLIGRRGVGRNEAAEIGRRLRKLAIQKGFNEPSRKVFDPLYGSVNAWHWDLLNLYFKTSLPRPYGGRSVR